MSTKVKNDSWQNSYPSALKHSIANKGGGEGLAGVHGQMQLRTSPILKWSKKVASFQLEGYMYVWLGIDPTRWSLIADISVFPPAYLNQGGPPCLTLD